MRTELRSADLEVAQQTLDDARALVAPALRRAVDGLPESVRHVVGHHFGWWDAQGSPLPAAEAGKGFRSALALAACEAVGGDRTRALPAAVAVDLVHNASLLHDDIIDQDALRRHRPAVWSVFGMPAAILAGDALFFLTTQVLIEASAPLADAGLAHLSTAIQQLVGGEFDDILFERQREVSPAECLAMATAKTGSLLAASCALGAIAAGAEAGRVEHLRAFGEQLGTALQLVDDVLGIWGSEERTGKPRLSDLRSRKKSLPVVAALAGGGAASRRLARLYGSDGPLTEQELELVADLVEDAGGRAWAVNEAERARRDALEHLAAAHPQPGPAGALTAIARLVTARDH
ncbi:polyprenyl synthetase family protein [Kitasatospora atroaurantiaca]|uniref:Geranylgeranyl diphosphate synthase type I n=1 Tax=Kitasatospora atroaurantiaca TaxID=285545 RepID=A0A561EXW8_9ACTN|nr:polyprenyl synthetase family protein [Kitasatospora atroaurantiaca]TWE20458.1 geranylgeranyl diphosphate synthase type I [Kitasatospora atroaurantiaca]